MGPFDKERHDEQGIPKQELEALFATIAEKWIAFDKLQWKPNVPLDERVRLFLGPALDGLIKAKPAFAFLPTEIVTLIFANGLVQAGTHSALEIQDALGIPRAGGQH